MEKEVDAKEDSIGRLKNFGKFQTLQFFLICLPLIVVAMTYVNFYFVVSDVKYRCIVPECDNVNSTVEKPIWWPENTDSKCLRPVFDGNCSNKTRIAKIEKCNKWIYENEDSVVSQLNLACDPAKANMIGSIHNAGMIFSMLITGWISDRFGRKPTLVFCSVSGVIGITKIFVKIYYIYITIEFLESFFASGLYVVGLTLLTEIGGNTKRLLAGVVFSYPIYTGEIIFAFVAMGVRNWKNLILITYSPAIIFLLYTFLIRESLRWQILNNHFVKARRTLNVIAKMNNIDLSEADLEKISDEELINKYEVQDKLEKESIRDVFSSRELVVRVIVASFCYFTSGFVYYGMASNCVLLPGNKYVNFALLSIASYPGDLLVYFTFDKYGRKVSLQCAYLSSSVFLIAQNYVPETLQWLHILLFLCGKVGVAFCFTGIYIYSMELFPTSVRGTLSGFGNTCSRIGSMLAPLTPLLVKEMAILPSLLFALTSIISLILLFFSPETRHLPLIDSITQVQSHKESDKV